MGRCNGNAASELRNSAVNDSGNMYRLSFCEEDGLFNLFPTCRTPHSTLVTSFRRASLATPTLTPPELIRPASGKTRNLPSLSLVLPFAHRRRLVRHPPTPTAILSSPTRGVAPQVAPASSRGFCVAAQCQNPTRSNEVFWVLARSSSGPQSLRLARMLRTAVLLKRHNDATPELTRLPLTLFLGDGIRPSALGAVHRNEPFCNPARHTDAHEVLRPSFLPLRPSRFHGAGLPCTHRSSPWFAPCAFLLAG